MLVIHQLTGEDIFTFVPPIAAVAIATEVFEHPSALPFLK